jgi:hypothetical protein
MGTIAMIGGGFVCLGGDGGGGSLPSSVNVYGVATFPRWGKACPLRPFGAPPPCGMATPSQRERQVTGCVAMEQCVHLAPPLGELSASLTERVTLRGFHFALIRQRLRRCHLPPSGEGLPSPPFGAPPPCGMAAPSQMERQVAGCVAMEQCVHLAPPMGELSAC